MLRESHAADEERKEVPEDKGTRQLLILEEGLEFGWCCPEVK